MLYLKSSLRTRIPLELTHSLWGAEKPSEIILKAVELHILCLTPASNSRCHNLLVLHPATLDVFPWRTDMEEQKMQNLWKHLSKFNSKQSSRRKRTHLTLHTKQKEAVVWGNTTMTQINTHTDCYTFSAVISEAQSTIPSYRINQPWYSCSKCLRTWVPQPDPKEMAH